MPGEINLCVSQPVNKILVKEKCSSVFNQFVCKAKPNISD